MPDECPDVPRSSTPHALEQMSRAQRRERLVMRCRELKAFCLRPPRNLTFKLPEQEARAREADALARSLSIPAGPVEIEWLGSDPLRPLVAVWAREPYDHEAMNAFTCRMETPEGGGWVREAFARGKPEAIEAVFVEWERTLAAIPVEATEPLLRPADDAAVAGPLSPYERAVAGWIERLTATWTPLDGDALTAADEQALSRLVRGGFVEAKLPVSIHRAGDAAAAETLWRVRGEYGERLGAQVKTWCASSGQAFAGAKLVVGRFAAARLTEQGEQARADLRGQYSRDLGEPRRGIPLGLWQDIAGGASGRGGIVEPGVVSFEGETKPAGSPATMTSATPEGRSETAANASNAARAGKLIATLGLKLRTLATTLERFALLRGHVPADPARWTGDVAGFVADAGRVREMAESVTAVRIEFPVEAGWGVFRAKLSRWSQDVDMQVRMLAGVPPRELEGLSEAERAMVEVEVQRIDVRDPLDRWELIVRAFTAMHDAVHGEVLGWADRLAAGGGDPADTHDLQMLKDELLNGRREMELLLRLVREAGGPAPAVAETTLPARPAEPTRADAPATAKVSGGRSGVSVEQARKLAETHCQRNPFPGVRALARLVKCSQATMHKAIKHSPELRRLQRESKAGHGQGVPTVAMTDGVAASEAQTREASPVDEATLAETRQRHEAIDRDPLLRRLIADASDAQRQQYLNTPLPELKELAELAYGDREAGRRVRGRRR